MNQSEFEINGMKPAPSAGKRVRSCYDWFWLSFSLVEKVARVYFLTNHRAYQSKTKAISKLLSTAVQQSIENRSKNCQHFLNLVWISHIFEAHTHLQGKAVELIKNEKQAINRGPKGSFLSSSNY